MSDYDEFAVCMGEHEMNVNNLQEYSVYSIIDPKTEKPFQRPLFDRSVPMCDMCFAKFPTFSSLYTHRSRPCFESGICEQPFPHPLRIEFPVRQLVYIEDAITSLHLSLETMEDRCRVTVDQSMLEVTLRRFYFSQLTKYNLEQWYKPVYAQGKAQGCHRAYTPRTLVIPLSDEELKTISRFASLHLAANLGMSSRPTNAEMAAYDLLQDRIQTVIEEDGAREYFCKFSTRSPKDSTAASREEDSVELALAKKIHSLKVTSGDEVLQLITKSQRIFSDIELFFHYRVPDSSSGQLALLLRDWETMPQDHEFRCYVSQGQLTAISQYHCYHRFESLQQKEHVLRIREAIEQFHELVHSSLSGLPDYVMDVAVFSDYSCQLIELNPFGQHMSSGSGLFHWVKDWDLLCGGLSRRRPAIRVLKELVE